MAGKHPTKVLLLNIFTTFLFHFFFLSIPGIILLIAGIWSRACLYISLGLLLADVILSVREGWNMKKAVETESFHPVFSTFQKAILSPDWQKKTGEFLEDLSRRSQSPNEPQ